MPKIIVGRRVSYLEIFMVDTDKVPSMRDDMDLCQRVLWAADPALTQQLRTPTEEGKNPIRLLCRVQDGITENPVSPVKLYEVGLDEAPEVK